MVKIYRCSLIAHNAVVTFYKRPTNEFFPRSVAQDNNCVRLLTSVTVVIVAEEERQDKRVSGSSAMLFRSTARKTNISERGTIR